MMRKILRWAGYTLAGLVGLIIVAYIVVYILSERTLRETHPNPVVAISIPNDSISIAEGERLVQTRGCFSCHGKSLEGGVLFDDPMLGKLVVPNLTLISHKYNDASLAAAIRNGIRADGSSMMVMPSMALAALTDEDVGDIIAYLHTIPEQEGPEASVTLGPLGRLGVVIGKFKTMAQQIAETKPLPPAANKDAELGRYIAASGCAECHGTDLAGSDHGEFVSTTLATVKGYSAEDFAKLLRTGVGLGGRELGMMTKISRSSLTHLTDAEIASLYVYLHELPE